MFIIVKSYLFDRKIDTLYNVAYSPELNPIEEVFGVLKRSIRNNIVDNIRDLKRIVKEEVERMNKELDIGEFYKHSFGI